MCKIQLPHQHVYVTDGCEAVAIWAPPDKWKVPSSEIIKATPAFLSVFGVKQFVSALGALSLLEKNHPKEPHYYLEFLGTDPAHQRKGLGGAVLGPVLERCDTEGVGVYLESSKDVNVPYYRHFGFEVRQEVTHKNNGPTQWLMWRDPKSAGKHRVGEAGLGPAEIGEKIAEHREHTLSHEPTGRDRTVTIIEAALLAMVALLAAWSGFASAKWSTESRLQLAEASAARTEANRAATVAGVEQGIRLPRVQCVVRCLHRRQHRRCRHRRASLPTRVRCRVQRMDRDEPVQRRRCPARADVHARVQAARARPSQRPRSEGRRPRRKGGGVGRARGPLRPHHGLPRDRALPGRHQWALQAAARPATGSSPPQS